MAVKWSYSNLKLFELCPRKFHELKVLKRIKEPETEQQRFGDNFHKAADNAVKKDTPLPKEFSFASPVVETFKKMDGEKHTEMKLGVRNDLSPCSFFDPAVWGRAIVDLAIIKGTQAWLLDYKTGKDRFPDKDQLMLMALFLMAHFKDVETVRAALVFVVKNSMVKQTIRAEEKPILWAGVRQRVASLENTYAEDVWNPVRNFTCAGYCPVKECEYWEPKRRK